MSNQKQPIPKEKREKISNELQSKVEKILSDLDPIKHLKNLDYPRRAETDGEKKASEYLSSTLQQYGLKPAVQEFHFLKPKTLPRFILPLILIIWGSLSLINVQLLDNNTVAYVIISVIILLLPIGSIIFLFTLGRIMKARMPKRRKKLQKIESKIREQTLKKDDARVVMSRNVIAEIGSKNAEKQILFTAHYDSISSKVPMNAMKIFGLVGGIGFLLYSLTYLANMISDLGFSINFMKAGFPFILVFLIVIILSLEFIIAARMFKGDESHGVIDDGTGVAILLELAKFLKNSDNQDYRFIFGFFSAEEVGLIGSGSYYVKNVFDKNKLHVISVDMIGEKSPLAYVKGVNPIRKTLMDAEFNSRIDRIAKQLEIEIKGRNFLFPGSDFAHWLLDGYKANWFISRSKLIHSKNDNLANLNEVLVIDALKIIIGYLIEFL